MHCRHFVLVHAPQDSTPSQEVHNAMGRFEESDAWFDWFQIGGRWRNEISELTQKVLWPNQLEHADAVPLSEIDAAKLVLDRAKDNQDTEFREFWAESRPVLAELTAHDDPREWIEQQNKHKWEYTYALSRVRQLLDGTWTSSSYYWDSIRHTTDPRYALEALDAGEFTPLQIHGQHEPTPLPLEEVFLVCVDFHF